ncbi:hypothetical protein Tdes44962_MAKER05098 [Teratosphaeria destructans]|uniref:Uncharacterized protein n=1 Tax=Teratosphaeria destructans TaxID=418781 RepID=A0A9W7VZM2_9PEZI|nr:hypothetical protein Tdes44962_MAKER05098 [Teratosphaeria destructans]
MARTLPWLVQDKTQASGATTSSTTASNRKRDATPDDLVDKDLNSTGASPPGRRKTIRSGRAASSSPPPVPEEAPPVEYMREGLAQDDAWMMVEDEFYSTAQVFTKHIHHAEYVRLKKRAKARGADTLQEISRPTDGRTAQSTTTKLELEAKERRKQIQKSLKAIESDEEEDEYMQDPQLALLMTGPQRNGQELRGVAKLKSNTRAAAGFSRSPKKSKARAENNARDVGKASAMQQSSSMPDGGADSETEDDDLDAPPRTKKPSPIAKPHHPVQTHESVIASASRSTGRESASKVFKQFSKSSAGRSEQKGKSQDTMFMRSSTESQKTIKVEPTSSAEAEGTSIDDLIAQAPRKTGILAKLKAARERKEQERIKEEEDLGDVPTFLI